MKKIIFFLLLITSCAYAVCFAQPQGKGVVSVTEEDGSPDVYPWRLKFANGNVTDNGDGTASIAGGSGAPTDADYLVGTANGSLSAEIVVGTAPGGELGGTWSSPTVDTTHSGSAHHTAVTLGTDADVLLGLTTQQIDLDTQTANYVFAGPTAAPAADPTFRALVDNDVPDTITLTNLTQVTTRSHTSLSDIGTNTHAQIDTHITNDADLSTTNELPTAGTAIDVTGQQVDFDSTEIEATTWGAGGNASNIWTYNLSGTDVTATWGSDLLTLSGSLTLSTGKNLKIGTTQWNSGDSIDGTKVANADLGEITVASGVWSVDSGSILLSELGGGAAGANAYDFGGATSFEIPNTNADVSLTAAGQLHLNTLDEQLSFHSAADGEISGEAAISLLRHITVTFDPSGYYDQETTYRVLPVMYVGDDCPEGFTITEIQVNYVKGDPTTELTASLCYDTTPDFNPAVGMTVMDVISTTAGAFSADTGFDNATAPNGSQIYIYLQADPTDANIVVTINIWGYNEED